ncbi:MAG TPA: MFS transporter, partial [Rhizobiaceae bacterium]|nr:MFS transporter [Rhizobiaceae bacterium]
MLPQILPVSPLLLSAFFMLIGLGISTVLIPLGAAAHGWSSVTLAWIGTAYAVAFTGGSVIVAALVPRPSPTPG